MKKYWWVNHKQTFDHEISGGYVWAPKVKRNGQTSHFYDNLRVASPGDVVISFANAVVSYVGLVIDYAISSPKPDSFGNAGEAWSDDGWMLPVSWYKVDTPFKPSLFINSLPALIRPKYAPIRAQNGYGNQGAYLSEIDQSLLNFVLAHAAPHLDLSKLLSDLKSEMHDAAAEIDEIVEQKLLVSKSLSETDKTQLIKARRGQGVFRANVQQHEHACRVTGVQSGFLLIASHIKPWRSCINSDERLDGNNGLLLTPHVDRLFDRGYITFNNLGGVILSSKIGEINISRLGISESYFEKIPFGLAKQKYLNYHRENVFLG